jgi:hypothetical protein
MFIFLLLGSRYIELSASRSAARALERLRHALPAAALRMAGYPHDRTSDMVAAGQLREGDMILVRSGEAIAADGIIAEGATEVDLALLTGESRAQPRGVGEQVPGGASMPASHRLRVRAGRKARWRCWSPGRARGQNKPGCAVGRQGRILVRAGAAGADGAGVRRLAAGRSCARLAGGDRAAGGVLSVRAVAGDAHRARRGHRPAAAARRAGGAAARA